MIAKHVGLKRPRFGSRIQQEHALISISRGLDHIWVNVGAGEALEYTRLGRRPAAMVSHGYVVNLTAARNALDPYVTFIVK